MCARVDRPALCGALSIDRLPDARGIIRCGVGVLQVWRLRTVPLPRDAAADARRQLVPGRTTQKIARLVEPWSSAIVDQQACGRPSGESIGSTWLQGIGIHCPSMARHCVPSLQLQNATGRQSRSPQQLAPAGSLSSEYQSCPLAPDVEASSTTLSASMVCDVTVVWHMTDNSPHDQQTSVDMKEVRMLICYHKNSSRSMVEFG
jgi:hypothetical protein